MVCTGGGAAGVCSDTLFRVLMRWRVSPGCWDAIDPENPRDPGSSIGAPNAACGPASGDVGGMLNSGDEGGAGNLMDLRIYSAAFSAPLPIFVCAFLANSMAPCPSDGVIPWGNLLANQSAAVSHSLPAPIVANSWSPALPAPAKSGAHAIVCLPRNSWGRPYLFIIRHDNLDPLFLRLLGGGLG